MYSCYWLIERPHQASIRPNFRGSLFVLEVYNQNPFHNFEHASHVTMSTCKLLSRIVAPEEVMESTTGKKKQDVASELHDYTYGRSDWMASLCRHSYVCTKNYFYFSCQESLPTH
jgi:hypothetical protein